MNDNPPTFQQDNYEVTVSEAAPFGSVILTVMARDEDGPGEVARKKAFFFSFFTSARSIFHALFFPFNVLPLHIARAHTGMNSAISYSIQTDNKSIAEFFHVDENEGTVFLKKSLDHETIQRHHFTIRASDKGSPTLSSSKYHHVTTRCSESSN